MFMQNSTKKVKIIAIDGEPAAGKGTLAKALAKHYDMLYMDTGAMFRAFGLYFVQNNIEITDENIKKYIERIVVDLKYENYELLVFLNGCEVTKEIRTSEAAKAAKTVSKFNLVRKKMLELQREIAKNTDVVIDGQDIGTVVFPNADFKFFVVASLDERARRRYVDFQKKGENTSFEDVKKDIMQRTEDDYERKIAPLKKADDAYLIDNSNLTKKETLDKVVDIIEKRMRK